MKAAMLILACYLMGSIPTGLIFCRLFYGIDIRTQGSRNTGATNVARVVGIKAGVIVLLIDAFLGGAAVIMGYTFSLWVYFPVLCGFMVIVGHVFSVFLKFHGGKGVATSLGVFVVLTPAASLLSLAVWLLLVFSTRIVAIGSLAAATLFPVSVQLLPCFFPAAARPEQRFIFWSGLVMALLVWLTHIKNIKRIRAGTENKFGSKK